MEISDIEKLILYHQAGLNTYRLQMDPSAQVLETMTIEALKELKKRLEG